MTETFLTPMDVETRLQCDMDTATQVTSAFVTAERLCQAAARGEDLTSYYGIDGETAATIREWWDEREEREGSVPDGRVETAGARLQTVHHYHSWWPAIWSAVREVKEVRTDGGQSTSVIESRLSHRRSSNYLRDDAELNECYCCGGDPSQIHHISYHPEETVPVCTACHGKIHDDSTSWDHLEPKQSRPDNYETRRREDERIQNHAPRAECVDCGGRFVFAELYPLEYVASTVKRRLRKKALSQINTRFRCFRCMGKRSLHTGTDRDRGGGR